MAYIVNWPCFASENLFMMMARLQALATAGASLGPGADGAGGSSGSVASALLQRLLREVASDAVSFSGNICLRGRWQSSQLRFCTALKHCHLLWVDIACGSMQVARIVEDVLSVLSEEAARENDKLQLFTDADRFPEVFQQVWFNEYSGMHAHRLCV